MLQLAREISTPLGTEFVQAGEVTATHVSWSLSWRSGGSTDLPVQWEWARKPTGIWSMWDFGPKDLNGR